MLGWGVVDGAITVYHWTEKPGEEEVIQGGVVAGARFRIPGSESRFIIPVQNLAGARGSGLVGEISWLPDHPGGPQFLCPGPWNFSPGISAPEFHPRKSRRPDPSSVVALVLRAGFLKTNFYFFPKKLLGNWDHLFFGFCSNNSYLKSDHF